jgi:thiol-disulfide isomerase/thioredoxin
MKTESTAGTRSTAGFLARAIRVAALFVALPVAAVAEDDSKPELLPHDPAAWLNSPPLTEEALKGKGVVLWFFEETCPTCRGKWPMMYQLAQKYEGQPVVFIAVNSGNPPAVVQQYAREVGLKWPIIVDPFREFENQWLDTQISLQNIHQCEIILPGGEKGNGRWDNLEGSVQDALKGASWKIDPQTIPAALMPTWQQVELGNYAAAASLLKKGLVTKNAEVKDAATRLFEFVQKELASAIKEASDLRAKGDSWRAFQLYGAAAKTFAGYDLPPEVATAQKQLAADAKVKKELDAARSLTSIKKMLTAARTPAALKRARLQLEKLTADHSGTDAAREASALLSGEPMP